MPKLPAKTTARNAPRRSDPTFAISTAALIRILRLGAKPLAALRLHDGVLLTDAADALAAGPCATTTELIRKLRRGETALVNAGWRRQARELGKAAAILAAAARPSDHHIAAMLRDVAHRDVDPSTPEGARRVAELLECADALAPDDGPG